MQIHFSEQDVVDACCVYVARRQGEHPQDVEVELRYTPGHGFSAEARVSWRHVQLTEQDMIDAVATYPEEYHNFNPRDLTIHLQFPDENRIEAYIVVAG
jgi:hypothetical protein